jgi:hypothetical protein
MDTTANLTTLASSRKQKNGEPEVGGRAAVLERYGRPAGRVFCQENRLPLPIWSADRRMKLRRWSPIAPQLVANLAVAADAKTILSLASAVMTRPDIQSGGLATKHTTRRSLLDADTGR